MSVSDLVLRFFPCPSERTPFMPRHCARCGAMVNVHMWDRHTRWHAAVDTAATTLLPSDPKGQS